MGSSSYGITAMNDPAFSWISSVLIPLGLMVSVGSLQALYIGLVVSRILQFRNTMLQAKTNAVQLLIQLPKFVVEADDFQARYAYNHFLKSEVIGLRTVQHQSAAAAKLLSVEREFLAAMKAAREEHKRPLDPRGLVVGADGFCVSNAITDDEIRSLVQKLEALILKIDEISPNWWAVLYVPLLGRFIQAAMARLAAFLQLMKTGDVLRAPDARG